jgi:PmbA protein
MFGEKQAEELCHQVLKRGGSDPVEVMLSFEDSALTRFANNTIHQNVAERNANVLVRYHVDQRVGTAETNRLDDRGLEEAVEKARANAESSAADPNYSGLAEPASYDVVDSFDQATAELSPAARALEVSVICRIASEKGLNASGAFSCGSGELAIANNKGLFAYHAATNADFQTVVMSDDSSSRTQLSSWRVGEIPVTSLGIEAIDKAEKGRKPRDIEPGNYTVILDHYVTEDLLNSLNFYGMGAQAVLEGRSWMNDRIGEKAMSERISIWDDGLDLHGIPQPFDFEGTPKQRVDLVTQGIVKQPVHDRYTAQKSGIQSTGHALPPTMRSYSPIATNLFMATGEHTLEEMIATTDRGLYINRFWYTRLVHPRDCVITGMTRDGVFLIENGELAYPVKNLRFTQSYVSALADVEAVEKENYLILSEFGRFAVRVPALKIRNFTFTGKTV